MAYIWAIFVYFFINIPKRYARYVSLSIFYLVCFFFVCRHWKMRGLHNCQGIWDWLAAFARWMDARCIVLIKQICTRNVGLDQRIRGQLYCTFTFCHITKSGYSYEYIRDFRRFVLLFNPFGEIIFGFYFLIFRNKLFFFCCRILLLM